MATHTYSTTADAAHATALEPRKRVIYDSVTRDYCCRFDGRLIGYASTYAAGVAMLDDFAHDLLVAGLLDLAPDTPPAPPAPPAPPTTASSRAPDDWQLTRLSLTSVQLANPTLGCRLILTTTQLAALRALLDACIIVPPAGA